MSLSGACEQARTHVVPQPISAHSTMCKRGGWREGAGGLRPPREKTGEVAEVLVGEAGAPELVALRALSAAMLAVVLPLPPASPLLLNPDRPDPPRPDPPGPDPPSPDLLSPAGMSVPCISVSGQERECLGAVLPLQEGGGGRSVRTCRESGVTWRGREGRGS